MKTFCRFFLKLFLLVVFLSSPHSALAFSEESLALLQVLKTTPFTSTNSRALKLLLEQTEKALTDNTLSQTEKETLSSYRQLISKYLVIHKSLSNCGKVGASLQKSIDSAFLFQSAQNVDTPQCADDNRSYEKWVNGLSEGILKEDFYQELSHAAFKNAVHTFLFHQWETSPTELKKEQFVQQLCSRRAGCSIAIENELRAETASFLDEVKQNKLIPTGEEKTVRELNRLSLQFKKNPKNTPLNSGKSVLFYSEALSPWVREPYPKKDIQAVDVRRALNEIRGSVMKQITEYALSKNSASVSTRDSRLQLLTVRNPVAVAQTLIRHPEMSKLACVILNEAQKDKTNSVSSSEMLIWGGVILGAACIATGALAPAGGIILAGTAASTTLASTAALLTLTATAWNASSMILSSKELFDHQIEAQKWEQALLTGNGTVEASEKRKEELERFSEEATNLAINFGLSLLDLKILSDLSKSGVLKQTTDFFVSLSKEKDFLPLLKRIRTDYGSKHFLYLLKQLSMLKASARKSALLKMRNWSKDDWIVFFEGTKYFIKASTKEFLREVKATKGLRLLLTKRQQLPHGKLPKDIQSWLFHPVESVFNTSKELTLLPSTAIFTVLVEKPLSFAQEVMNEKTKHSLILQKDKIPGADFGFELSKSGLIDEIKVQKIIGEHQRTLSDWFSKKRASLPKIDEAVRLKLLTPDEAELFQSIARMQLEETLRYFESGEAAQDNVGVDSFDVTLVARLKQSIDSHTRFSKFSESRRELLATLLWPSYPLGRHSELEISKTLFEAQEKETRNGKDAAYKTIFNLMQDGLSFPEAYSMTAKVMENENKKDLSAWEQIGIPKDRLNEFQRPALPQCEVQLELRLHSNGKKITFSSEFERWSFFLKDPHFEVLRNHWKSRDITSLQAMDTFDRLVPAYNDLYPKIEEWNQSRMRLLKEFLVGGKEITENTLLYSIWKDLDREQKIHDWDPAAQMKCTETVVDLFFKFYDSFSNEKLMQDYNEILSRCSSKQ